MQRFVSLFWVVCALIVWARGEPRFEFLFCLLMSALVGIAAEARDIRKAIEAKGDEA